MIQQQILSGNVTIQKFSPDTYCPNNPDQADWSSNDPSFISARIADLGDYMRWAKNWVWANQALVSDAKTTEENVFIGFDAGLKGMILWDTAISPFNADIVIQYMIDNGKFDELSVSYVNSKTPTAVF